MGSAAPSLYEPINRYKPLGPDIGVVDGRSSIWRRRAYGFLSHSRRAWPWCASATAISSFIRPSRMTALLRKSWPRWGGCAISYRPISSTTPTLESGHEPSPTLWPGHRRAYDAGPGLAASTSSSSGTWAHPHRKSGATISTKPPSRAASSERSFSFISAQGRSCSPTPSSTLSSTSSHSPGGSPLGWPECTIHGAKSFSACGCRCSCKGEKRGPRSARSSRGSRSASPSPMDAVSNRTAARHCDACSPGHCSGTGRRDVKRVAQPSPQRSEARPLARRSHSGARHRARMKRHECSTHNPRYPRRRVSLSRSGCSAAFTSKTDGLSPCLWNRPAQKSCNRAHDVGRSS